MTNCWCKYVFTIYTYLSLLRLMHYFIILYYFIIYLGETLRSLCTLMSCHVDNTEVRNFKSAHGVYNIVIRTPDLRVTPL